MPVCSDKLGAQCAGQVYFLGPPQLYWRFGSLAFMLRNFPGQDVLPGELPADAAGPVRFIVIQDRIGELDAVMQAYPGGEPVPILGHDDRILALIYDWH